MVSLTHQLSKTKTKLNIDRVVSHYLHLYLKQENHKRDFTECLENKQMKRRKIILSLRYKA